MELSEIRDGDIVQLLSGEAFAVRSTCDGYGDRDGEHEGPFVIPLEAGRHRFIPLEQVAEVVRPNPRVCRFCGGGVTSTNPEVEFCRTCFYSGRSLEEARSEFLFRLRALDGVDTAEVWHMGGGCMSLVLRLTNGCFVMATDGEMYLPDPGEPWGFVVVYESYEQYEREAEGEQDFSPLALFEEALDEDAFVEYIGKVTRGEGQ